MKGIFWPAFWDTPAIAVSLSLAAGCFPGEGALQTGALRSRDLIDKQLRNNKQAIVKIQGVTTKLIREALYPNTLHDLFAKRLSALFPDKRAELAHVKWHEICRLL